MVEITSYLDNFHVVNLKNNAPYGNPVKNINRKSQMESDVHDRWWRSTEDLIFQLILWEAVDGNSVEDLNQFSIICWLKIPTYLKNIWQ